MSLDIQLMDQDVAFDERAKAYRIGLIALSTDHTTEPDFAAITRDVDCGVYVSRVEQINPTTIENLRLMAPKIGAAAGTILPEEEVDAIAYSCTSASVAIGNEEIAARIWAVKPGVPVVTPTSAAFAGFAALGVRRVSLLTPYLPSVTEAMAAYFEAHGLEIVNAACLGIEDDRDMARVSPRAVVAKALEVIDPAAEGLFLSCTALRAAEVAGEIEAAIGRPVVTSNQAQAWRCLRLAGCPQKIEGYGRLLSL